MIKNTKKAGITAAAGTRLALSSIRLVIHTIINYLGDPLGAVPGNPQDKECPETGETLKARPDAFRPGGQIGL